MTILDAATPVPVSPDPFACLGAGGEVFRQHDWSASPLGPPEAWPCALRDALRLMLASPQPTWLGWGQGPDDLVLLYNDAYRPVLGSRHPAALGRPLTEAMPEIWSGIRDAALPFFDEARRSPEGVPVDSRRFILERGDLPEEAYLSLSLIPLTDDEGRVQGLLCPSLDETRRIVGERQLATVAELAERTAGLQTGPALSDAVVAALSTNPWDLPFAILFIKGPKGFEACHVVGIDPCHAAAAPERWPLAEALASPRPLPIHDLADRLGTDLPTGACDIPPRSAHLLPLRPPVEEAPPAILGVALNPFRRLDESYGRFLGLLARRLESVMSASFALDLARTRREAHAALRAAADRAAFLSDLGEALRLIEDPEAVMAEAAARLGQRLGTARCAFSEIKPDSGTLTFACDWTDGRLPPAPRSLPLAISTRPWSRTSPRERRSPSATCWPTRTCRPPTARPRKPSDRSAPTWPCR